MTQYTNDGEICAYSDFRWAAIKPRRTERAQRQEIESSLDRLTAQGDYWSLDIIRKIATALTGDTDEQKHVYNLYSILLKIVLAQPGEWITWRKK